ncbi:MAG: hypothetical protein GKS07_11390 [Nitrosopumilus sp.]|nr:MAG: hypothetical protein GKS07_00245 [Nitrosopumilus sp.]QMU55437.1 MAG: hypothetical protein GKS07_11390 [Nitrosopumilus sp.]
MQKQWTAYDENAGKFVNLIDPELVTLANGQKAVMGENADTGKLLYKIISSEEARVFFKK